MRTRRTRDELERIRVALLEIARQEHPMTLRNLYYRAVVESLVEKSDAGYDTVGRLVLEMRRASRLPWSWIHDGTRRVRCPTAWADLDHRIRHCVTTYRRDIWAEQPSVVQVWVESGSLASVLEETTGAWIVPLAPCNGQPSATFVWQLGTELADETRPVHILYVGDYDRAGMLISDRVPRELREHAPDLDLRFTRLAVNADQIRNRQLPTHAAKPKDLAAGWVGECCEAEAIPIAQMRELVDDAIRDLVDLDALAETQESEREDRARLEQLLGAAA